VYTGYAWSNLRGQRPLGRPRRELENNIKRDILRFAIPYLPLVLRWIFMKWDRAWTGMIWIRLGTGGGLFKLRQ